MSFDLSPRHAVDDPVTQRSRSTVEGILTKAQFSSSFLYQIHCIDPVGFGFAHIYSERSPPKTGPYKYYKLYNIIISCDSLYVYKKKLISNETLLAIKKIYYSDWHPIIKKFHEI